MTQADFILQLCAACGLKQVLLGGHSDGALLSLMAAAAASRYPDAFLGFLMPSVVLLSGYVLCVA